MSKLDDVIADLEKSMSDFKDAVCASGPTLRYLRRKTGLVMTMTLQQAVTDPNTGRSYWVDVPVVDAGEAGATDGEE